MLVGALISSFTLAGQLESLIFMMQGDPMNALPALLSVGAAPLIGIGLAALGCFLLDLWLKPYEAASEARPAVRSACPAITERWPLQ